MRRWRTDASSSTAHAPRFLHAGQSTATAQTAPAPARAVLRAAVATVAARYPGVTALVAAPIPSCCDAVGTPPLHFITIVIIEGGAHRSTPSSRPPSVPPSTPRMARRTGGTSTIPHHETFSTTIQPPYISTKG